MKISTKGNMTVMIHIPMKPIIMRSRTSFTTGGSAVVVSFGAVVDSLVSFVVFCCSAVRQQCAHANTHFLPAVLLFSTAAPCFSFKCPSFGFGCGVGTLLNNLTPFCLINGRNDSANAVGCAMRNGVRARGAVT